MKGKILFCAALASLALLVGSVYAQNEAAPAGGEEQVESSAIDSVQYDEATQELTVKLDDGDTYVYKAVPKDVYDALMAAESKGTYYNENIKGKYEYTEKE